MASLSLTITIDLLSQDNSLGDLRGPSNLGSLRGSSGPSGLGGLRGFGIPPSGLGVLGDAGAGA